MTFRTAMFVSCVVLWLFCVLSISGRCEYFSRFLMYVSAGLCVYVLAQVYVCAYPSVRPCIVRVNVWDDLGWPWALSQIQISSATSWIDLLRWKHLQRSRRKHQAHECITHAKIQGLMVVISGSSDSVGSSDRSPGCVRPRPLRYIGRPCSCSITSCVSPLLPITIKGIPKPKEYAESVPQCSNVSTVDYINQICICDFLSELQA